MARAGAAAGVSHAQLHEALKCAVDEIVGRLRMELRSSLQHVGHPSQHQPPPPTGPMPRLTGTALTSPASSAVQEEADERTHSQDWLDAVAEGRFGYGLAEGSSAGGGAHSSPFTPVDAGGSDQATERQECRRAKTVGAELVSLSRSLGLESRHPGKTVHAWIGGHARGHLASRLLDGGEWVEMSKSSATATGSPKQTWALRSLHPVACTSPPGAGPIHKKLRRWARNFVERPSFDYMVGLLLVASAICIALQTDYMARNIGRVVPTSFLATERFFCIAFACELGARLYAYGPRFFVMTGWKWNIFDAIVVLLMLVEFIVAFAEDSLSISAIRMLRLVRMLRVMRVVRLIHLCRELRTMSHAIGAALQPFFWTLSFLGIFIFVVGVYFMQIIYGDATTSEAFEANAGLKKYWSTLPLSALSLFQAMTGGVDWENMLDPLIEQVSPWIAPLFLAYIAFGSFVMLSLITGIFFDLTFKCIQDTKDRELVHQVKELFLQSDLDSSGQISLQEFQRQVQNPLLREYFKTIDLDLSEARGLFNLLDTNGDGAVEAEEFVMGCLRLRGPARAIDLAALTYDTRQMFAWLRDAMAIVEEKVLATSR